ncbi:MAG: DEAD/DEAH box helicase [Planctomycetes bacterium]|nr:DEAD/DEAH box helicase [Planctomycetota bacterium]MBI3845030.1 DEAD/DEAH box helicase [Planctomycetota bacterium]
MKNPANPLTVQSDRSLLLEVENDLYVDARDGLARFAELEKSPEYIHTYRLTPLSVWNAVAAGVTKDEMLSVLDRFSKYDVPQNIRIEIEGWVERYGRVKLERDGDRLLLQSTDASVIAEIWRSDYARQFLKEKIDSRSIAIDEAHRGHVKQALLKLGYPVEDLAGYLEGAPLGITFRGEMVSGGPFELRAYQREAAAVFHAAGTVRGGSGVIVLPCGAGKTIVGLAVMHLLQTQTLILCTNLTAVRQWKREILDKLELPDDAVGEYSGESKDIRPITISTYQILTYRRRKTDAFLHFGLFSAGNWGLIIYDEVHLLPAPVFRVTAEIQARRRLGLTATLVREDHQEQDVFTLIGPKKYDVPWKVLEKQGWIAAARCVEVRVTLDADERMRYATAETREKFRIASENPAKTTLVRRILEHHRGDLVLVIGQYLDQLVDVSKRFELPIITGKTPQRDRDVLYARFRAGEVPVLVVSKVGNFSVDLPDANVAVQISGTFGSRQEEAQRLGRILRPKSNGSPATFYSLITRDTRDQEFASNRQLFLTEQGYSYEIVDGNEFLLESSNNGGVA